MATRKVRFGPVDVPPSKKLSMNDPVSIRRRSVLLLSCLFLSLSGLGELRKILPQTLAFSEGTEATYDELIQATDQAITNRKTRYQEIMSTADLKFTKRKKNAAEKQAGDAVKADDGSTMAKRNTTVESGSVEGQNVSSAPEGEPAGQQSKLEEDRMKMEMVDEQPELEEHHMKLLLAAEHGDEIRLDTNEEPIVTREDRFNLHCFAWTESSDGWWQDHPEWEIQQENTTHTCFSRMINDTKASFFQSLHQNQFDNNCTQLRTRFVLGTGFAASIKYLFDGFWSAFREGRPFTPSKHRADFRWMYAPPYNFENTSDQSSFAACPSQDTSCFFLPLSSCQNYTVGHEDSPWKKYYKGELRTDPVRQEQYLWLSQYFLRPLHIVRQRLVQLQQEQPPLQESHPDCTVLHVRRADATSEKRYPRNYYPLQQYLTRGNVTENSTVILLTDDQTTLEEARYLHPNYNWIYLQRERHRGHVSKGSHIPSGDEALEVLYILLELQLASQCTTLVHGTSNMVKLISQAMQLRHGMEAVQLVTIGDEKINFHEQTPIPPEVFMRDLEAKLKMAKVAAVKNWPKTTNEAQQRFRRESPAERKTASSSTAL